MLIKFGIINFKYLFLFLSPLFNAIRKLFKENDDNLNPFFISFINFLSLILCGSMFFLSEYLSKSDKLAQNNKINELIEYNEKSLRNTNSLLAQIRESNIKIKLDKIENMKKKEKNKLYFVLLLSSLQMLSEIIKKHFRNEKIGQFDYSLLVLIELFYSIVFSMMFLNFSIYKHQFVSFLIFFFCHFIIFIYTILNLKEKTAQIFKSFLYFYSFEKSYCLLDVLGKKYLDTFNDGVYLLLFKIGIIGLTPLLIYDIIANLCGIDDKYHGIIKTIFHNFKFWYFVSELFYSIIADIGIWLTINYFSPCHYIILEITKNILNLIILLIKKEEKDYFSKEELILFCVFYTIIIFDVLVFIEILILDFWGFSDNTRIKILKREKLDSKIVSTNLSSDSYEDRDESSIQDLELYKEEDFSF